MKLTLHSDCCGAIVGITRHEERQRGGEAGSAGVEPGIRDSHTGEGEGAGVGGARTSKCGLICEEGGAGWSCPHHLHSHTIHYVLLQGNGAGEDNVRAT